MHVLVIGATRGIGRAAVAQALERGHRVRAMARHSDRLDLEHPALKAVSADATDHAAVARALAGTDAVIQALGIGVRARSVLRPVTLFSDATRVLVAAMEAAGPRRLVAVTGFGTGDSAAALSRPEALGQGLGLGRIYADKTRQEAIIRESSLDWTIVRPAILTGGPPTGRYRVLSLASTWRNGLIARADVADFLVGALQDPPHVRRTPVLAY
jgi:putative NADH-flavin reductase